MHSFLNLFHMHIFFYARTYEKKYTKKLTYKNYARDLTNHRVHMYVRDLTKQFVCRNTEVKITKIICKDGSFQ